MQYSKENQQKKNNKTNWYCSGLVFMCLWIQTYDAIQIYFSHYVYHLMFCVKHCLGSYCRQNVRAKIKIINATTW